MTHLLILAIAWLAMSSAATAASFDCDKAATKVEKLICSDAALSKLDDELAVAYKTGRQDEKQAEAVRKAQKEWLKDRNTCSDAGCVKRVYEKRLQRLASSVSAHWPSERSDGSLLNAGPQLGKPRYGHCADVGIVGSCDTGQSAKTGKGYAVCETYLKYLNTLTDMPKCEAPIPPGFKRPEWEEMNVRNNIRLAYQAEAIYFAGWGVGKYIQPDFEIWQQQFLDEIRVGKIAPQMRKVRVQPFGAKAIILLAYTRDQAGCTSEAYRQNSRWAGNGYAHFLLTGDAEAPLRPIADRVSRAQSELLLYTGKPYFVLRTSYDTDIEIIAFDFKMTEASGIAASINAFYASVAPGTPVRADAVRKLEPDPSVYWAGQLCHFSQANAK